jgi:hypothetical protein
VNVGLESVQQINRPPNTTYGPQQKTAAARQPLRDSTSTLATENNAITLLQNFDFTNVVR